MGASQSGPVEYEASIGLGEAVLERARNRSALVKDLEGEINYRKIGRGESGMSRRDMEEMMNPTELEQQELKKLKDKLREIVGTNVYNEVDE